LLGGAFADGDNAGDAVTVELAVGEGVFWPSSVENGIDITASNPEKRG
jgi:hypothetical protein